MLENALTFSKRTWLQHMNEINDKKIQKWIIAGIVQGPFDNKPFPDLQCSTLGLVEQIEPTECGIHNLA